MPVSEAGVAACGADGLRIAPLTNFYCVCAFRSRQVGGVRPGALRERAGRGVRGGGSSNDTFARRSEARGNNELCT